MAKARYPFPGMNPYLERPLLWEPVHTRLIVAIANQLQPHLDPRYIASVEVLPSVESRGKPNMANTPYPFPGMNPYLEQRITWEGVHARLIPVIANQLQPLLDPRYVAAVEERVFVEGPQERIPDVWIERTHDRSPAPAAQATLESALIVEVEELEIHQKRVEILDTRNEMKVVTVIEVVSPTNKRSGAGRASYLGKQRQLRSSDAHVIEIDLLRRGGHVLAVPDWAVEERRPYDYLICVSRWPHRNRYEVYPRLLPERLPSIKVPLAAPDADVTLDLQTALEQVYWEGRYGIRLNYEKPCEPALNEADQHWAFEQLAKAGLRLQSKKPRTPNGKKRKG